MAAPTRLLLLAVGAALLAGCGVVQIGGSASRGDFDAHVVMTQRAGCATVAARTLRFGHTILTPLEPLIVVPTAVFEGPVREGESVFRYLAPNAADSWRTAEPTSVPVEVHAVRLTLPEVREALDARCGPLVPGEPGEALPRIPGQQPGL